MGYTLRQKAGAAALDWPRFELGLRSDWVSIRNRRERLEASPDGRGAACAWQWTSDLHVAKVFPSLGTRLMRRCLADWPIEFAPEPPDRHGEPQVSFVIGHRGSQRAPQLLTTLSTIAAQRGVGCECIVVEQSARSEVADRLPAWVRHVHTPLPVEDLPYCRSWALNVGARIANGKVLVFHDNDMLVPADYAAELWSRHEAGFEVANLKRFVFYLSANDSIRIQSGGAPAAGGPPEAVVQNLEAGGSVAVDKDAFVAIGGFDESFIGWGGEDNEFWERAQLRKVWPYAYLPIVHLWHPAQPRKADPANPNTLHQAALSRIPPAERASILAARDFGNRRGLSVPMNATAGGAAGRAG